MKAKVFIPVLAVLLACSATPQKQAQTQSEDVLTLMTYNVGAFCKYDYDSMPVVASVLKSFDADAISLNELDSCNTRSGVNNYQMERIAGMMGDWPFVYGSAISYKGGSYGIGVMAAPRHRVTDRWTRKLPKSDGREVRALAVIETEEFVFCSTHLDLTEQSQLDQVAAINEMIREKYRGAAKPVFLCGDMNAEPGSKTILEIQKEWTLLSSTDFSFSAGNPRKCIDFIFAYKNAAPVKVLEAKVQPLKDLSDHFPQIVRLQY